MFTDNKSTASGSISTTVKQPTSTSTTKGKPRKSRRSRRPPSATGREQEKHKISISPIRRSALVNVELPPLTTVNQEMKCLGCRDVITDKQCEKKNVIFADGFFFHKKHFKCVRCAEKLIDFYLKDFRILDNRTLMCHGCYMDLYHPKCAGCGRALRERCLVAMGERWHDACLKCARCNNLPKGGEYMEHNDTFFCVECYNVTIIEEKMDHPLGRQILVGTPTTQ